MHHPRSWRGCKPSSSRRSPRSSPFFVAVLAEVRCLVVAGLDFDAELKQLDATMTSIEKVLDLPALRKEIDELGEQVAAPDLWDDQANAQKVTSRLSSLQADVERGTALRGRGDDLGIMIELSREENDADSLAEAEKELGSLAKAIQSLEVRTLL